MPPSKFWRRNTSPSAQREIAATAAALGVDARAVNILYNSYFDADDKLLPWVEEPALADADFAIAKTAGLMFNPLQLDHDALITWVLEARKKIKPRAVGNAFIVSLASRRMDLRSALGSYAHVLHLKRHRFQKDDDDRCAVCGVRQARRPVDLSARNFRRLKWAGNVEQGDLEYAGCDLHLFAKLPPVTPSADETAILAGVLDAIRALPKTARLSELDKALVGRFKSTKAERQVVLEILGYAGVLQPKGWPSFFDAWVCPDQRTGPGRASPEWQFPTAGWSGASGVNEAAVKFWFPQLV